MLGEHPYDDGTTFVAKTRLVRFLHEQMGFNVLAFESGLYDCPKGYGSRRPSAQNDVATHRKLEQILTNRTVHFDRQNDLYSSVNHFRPYFCFSGS